MKRKMKMAKKYTPATFQPTVRPSWAGILSYISEKERSDILEAIIKFPEKTGIESRFWFETIQPDLQDQYEKFIRTCNLRGRGAKTYWGEHKDNLSYTQVKHNDKISITKDDHKDNLLKGQGQVKDKGKGNNNTETEKKILIEDGKFYMDDSMPEYKDILVGLTEEEVLKLWKWIYNKYYGLQIPLSKIRSMIINFKKQKGENK